MTIICYKFTLHMSAVNVNKKLVIWCDKYFLL